MTTTVQPYEILFRLNKSGEVVGCHRRDLKIVTDGPDRWEKELDPEPITGEEMDNILGKINTALVLTVQNRDAFIAQLTSALDESQSLIGNYALANANLKAQIAALTQDNKAENET
jgi:hypothetical protein